MGVRLRERKLKDGGKGYHLAIFHNGKYHYEFLDIHVRKEDSKEEKDEKKRLAYTIRSQREIELISRGSDYVPKHKQKADFLEFYADYLTHYSKKDVRMIKYSLAKFQSFLTKDDKDTRKGSTKAKALKSTEVTTALCEDFRDYLIKDADLKGETPHNYFARFKKVVKRAYKIGLLKEDPTTKLDSIKKESNTVRKQVLSEEELRLLTDTPCINDEVKRAFLFACSSGLGMAELKELTWGNVRNGRLITKREKSGREVNLKLSPKALQLLGKPGRSGDYIFNIQISDTSVNKDLQKWADKAGLEKNISFYCGRHTFAVRLLKNGANLKTVADAMGHANHNHTVKYLNYVDELKDEATAGLD